MSFIDNITEVYYESIYLWQNLPKWIKSIIISTLTVFFIVSLVYVISGEKDAQNVQAAFDIEFDAKDLVIKETSNSLLNVKSDWDNAFCSLLPEDDPNYGIMCGLTKLFSGLIIAIIIVGLILNLKLGIKNLLIL